jgi:3-oxoacyl-[acyl-carrier protein] reductase
MFDLTGKVAFVTGGSRGIGRATAEVLADLGAHVVLTYVGGEAQAREAVEGILQAGGKADAVRVDVSDSPAVEAAIQDAAKRLGRLDVLVANAGISIDGLLLRIKDEDFDRVLNVNLRGAVASARAAIKVMMRAKTGRVIFVSSVVGEMGNPGQTTYAASKAALLGVAKSLAKEYASRGITVNAVTPGYVDTDMTSSMTGEAREKTVAGIPLGRTGTAREIAAAIAYLASDEAAYVTGQALRVNGGMYM